VQKLVKNGYSTARQVIADNRDTLERVARALIEREILDANEIKLLVEGRELPPIPPPPLKPDDGVQHVIKPDLQPGRVKGGKRPAMA
jgi:cell division protease FtsH